MQASSLDPGELPTPSPVLIEAAAEPVPEAVHEVIGEAYLESARLLGRRTGELHACLASATPDERGGGGAFLPEEFTTLYQRSLYQSMRNLLGHTFRALERERGRLDGESADEAGSLLMRRGDLLARFRRILDRKLPGARIRVHGDYHLGQVLYTGKDFVIIDFEGEPARPLGERRLKRSPLRDVAGMLRSFHYASRSALVQQRQRGGETARSSSAEAWAGFWYRWVAAAFLRGYLEAMGDHPVLPGDPRDRQLLLEVFLLEKALYELAYEVNNRPGWVRIPLEGILELLGWPEAGGSPEPGPTAPRDGPGADGRDGSAGRDEDGLADRTGRG